MKKILSIIMSVVFLISLIQPFEIKANSAQNVTLNAVNTFNFSETNDEKLFKVVLNDNGFFSTTIEANCTDFSVTYYDENMNELHKVEKLVWNSSSKKLNHKETITLKYGTYYVKFNVADTYYISNTFYGQVKCQFTLQNAKETFKENSSYHNDVVENGKTIEFGKQYEGFIALNDEYDYYEFSINKSGKVYLELERDSENMMFRIERYHDNMDIWNAYSWNYDLDPSEEKEVYNVYLDKGKYKFVVHRYNQGYGQYKLKLSYKPYEETFQETYVEDVTGQIDLKNKNNATIKGVMT